MQRYTGPGLGGSQTQELPSLWSWVASSSQFLAHQYIQHIEALWSHYLMIFKEAWSIINCISSPFPFSRKLEGEGGLKVPASNHGLVFLVAISIQEPTKSHLIRTKHFYYPGNSKGFSNSVSAWKIVIANEIELLCSDLSALRQMFWSSAGTYYMLCHDVHFQLSFHSSSGFKYIFL